MRFATSTEAEIFVFGHNSARTSRELSTSDPELRSMVLENEHRCGFGPYPKATMWCGTQLVRVVRCNPNKTFILIMDAFAAHKTPAVKAAIKAAGVLPAIIPATSHLSSSVQVQNGEIELSLLAAPI